MRLNDMGMTSKSHDKLKRIKIQADLLTVDKMVYKVKDLNVK